MPGASAQLGEKEIPTTYPARLTFALSLHKSWLEQCGPRSTGRTARTPLIARRGTSHNRATRRQVCSSGRMHLADGRYIPVERAELRATTGSGPGGQHRNRSHTRIELRLPLALLNLTAAEEQQVRSRLRARIVDDAIVVRAGERRSQAANRQAAEERLLRLIEDALHVDPKRVGTRPTAGSRARRLEGKQQRAQTKQLRRVDPDE